MQRGTREWGEEAVHPIGVVSQRTGLSTDVLRVWERRYGVVTPERGPGGQRLYTDRDIERLRLLARATSSGRSIRQVAALAPEALTALVRSDEESAPVVVARPAPPDAETTIEAGLSYTRRMDAQALELVLRRAAFVWGAPLFLEHVAAPLFRRIGEAWHEGRLRPAHEHLASGVMRSILHGLRSELGAGMGAEAPNVVVATPAGELHEIGALLVAAAACAEGWRVTYLGPDLPAEEIAAAVLETNARAVGLSLVYAERVERVAAEVSAVRAALPADVTLLLGGSLADRQAAAFRQPGVEVVTSMAELGERLRTLG
jgi:MerR family transcriptional regulator, light-induced transcriptional regulator